MVNRLLLLFILLPIVEMSLLILLGNYIGFWSTILLIILTGLLGTWLAHSQGWSTYRRIQAELAQGRMPTDALIEGVMILVAGVLLLSPGVLTDLLGIVLMLPPSRSLCRAGLVAWFKRNFRVQTIVQHGGSPPRTFDSNVVDSFATESDAARGTSEKVLDSNGRTR